MEDPIELKNLFYGTMSGAAIVLTGALYALFFALGRVHGSALLGAVSIGSYLLLAAAVWVLAYALQLTGVWIFVAAVMLVGYFLAPRAIWKLCVGTHGGAASHSQ